MISLLIKIFTYIFPFIREIFLPDPRRARRKTDQMSATTRLMRLTLISIGIGSTLLCVLLLSQLWKVSDKYRIASKQVEQLTRDKEQLTNRIMELLQITKISGLQTPTPPPPEAPVVTPKGPNKPPKKRLPQANQPVLPRDEDWKKESLKELRGL